MSINLGIWEFLTSTHFFTSVHRTNASNIINPDVITSFQILTFKPKVAYESYRKKSNKQGCSFRSAVASMVPKLCSSEMHTLVITILISKGRDSINISS